ncbi:MAG: hypothetical protein ACK52W_01945 [Alphaproteobacteria bacterium]
MADSVTSTSPSSSAPAATTAAPSAADAVMQSADAIAKQAKEQADAAGAAVVRNAARNKAEEKTREAASLKEEAAKALKDLEAANKELQSAIRADKEEDILVAHEKVRSAHQLVQSKAAEARRAAEVSQRQTEIAQGQTGGSTGSSTSGSSVQGLRDETQGLGSKAAEWVSNVFKNPGGLIGSIVGGLGAWFISSMFGAGPFQKILMVLLLPMGLIMGANLGNNWAKGDSPSTPSPAGGTAQGGPGQKVQPGQAPAQPANLPPPPPPPPPSGTRISAYDPRFSPPSVGIDLARGLPVTHVPRDVPVTPSPVPPQAHPIDSGSFYQSA